MKPHPLKYAVRDPPAARVPRYCGGPPAMSAARLLGVATTLCAASGPLLVTVR